MHELVFRHHFVMKYVSNFRDVAQTQNRSGGGGHTSHLVRYRKRDSLMSIVNCVSRFPRADDLKMC